MAGQRVLNEVLLGLVRVAKQRVEHKRFLGAAGRGRRCVSAISRVEHARPGSVLGLGVSRRCPSRRHVARGRRQVERTLAAATSQRQRNHAQEHHSPSRRRAEITDHDDIPNAGRTIQRLPCDGESSRPTKLQRNSFLPPYFRCFSRRLAQALACAATFFGAVPPKLVRLFTEDSTESTLSASAVIFGSTSCIALSGNSCSATPCFEASATMRPVTWWASRNGIFSVRTSQSARSVAVAYPSPAAAFIRAS